MCVVIKNIGKNVPAVAYGINKDFSVVGQEPYDEDHIILPEVMKKNGYITGVFGKWAGGYEGSCSTPDKRGVDEFYGYICQFQAHLYYPNFLNRYSKEEGDTGVVRIVMEDNINYPMFGDDYKKRSQYSADLIHQKAMEWIDKQDGKQPFMASSLIRFHMRNWHSPMTPFLKDTKAFFRDKTWGGSKVRVIMPWNIPMLSLPV